MCWKLYSALFSSTPGAEFGLDTERNRATSLELSVTRPGLVSVRATKQGSAYELRVLGPQGEVVRHRRWLVPWTTTFSWRANDQGAYVITCLPQRPGAPPCELERLFYSFDGETPDAFLDAERSLQRGYDSVGVWSASSASEAVASLRQAVTSADELFGETPAFDARLALADALRLQGDGEVALQVLGEASSVAERLGDVSRSAWVAIELASNLVALGRGTEAERELSVANELLRESTSISLAARAKLVAADLHYLKSELGDAERLAREALALYQQSFDSEGEVQANLVMGYAQADQSRDDEARMHFETALELAGTNGLRREEAVALRVLGNVHSKAWRNYSAIEYFEKARLLFERARDRVALVGLYNGLGEVHLRLNDFSAARRYLEMARDLAVTTGFRMGEGTALIELAKCAEKMGDLDGAEAAYEAAKSVFERVGDRGMLGSALSGVGGILSRRGNARESFEYLERALRLKREAGDERASSEILNDLAEAFLAQGHWARARSASREALSLARSADAPAEEARAMFVRARLAHQEGRMVDARREIEAALALDEQLRATVPGGELRALFFSGVENRLRFYVRLLMESAMPDFRERALEAVDRSRARVLLDSTERVSGPPSSTEHSARVAQLQARIRMLARDRDVPEVGENGVNDALLMARAELRRLRGLNPSARVAVVETLPVDVLRTKLLDGQSVMLAYLLDEPTSYLWVVDENSVVVHTLPPRAELEELAERVYRGMARVPDDSGALESSPTDEPWHADAVALSGYLLGPVNRLGRYERLLIVADGLLHYLPFAALPDPAGFLSSSSSGGQYRPLVLSHEIVRAPSPSATAALTARHDAVMGGIERSLAVVADPVFTTDDPRLQPFHRMAGGREETSTAFTPSWRSGGSGQADRLERLLGSREEAASIVRSSNPWHVELATDFRATREIAEGLLNGPHRVVHFATHGILNDEFPELSGLVLGLVGPDGAPRDGFLRAQDVLSMRIGADLVVLSACETGLGDLVRGEGITGLVGAFLQAGANTVVATMWRVDDAATSRLMEAFYRHLLRDGLDPASALRSAQIQLWSSARTRSPFFWAAFEVYGSS